MYPSVKRSDFGTVRLNQSCSKIYISDYLTKVRIAIAQVLGYVIVSIAIVEW